MMEGEAARHRAEEIPKNQSASLVPTSLYYTSLERRNTLEGRLPVLPRGSTALQLDKGELGWIIGVDLLYPLLLPTLFLTTKRAQCTSL